MTHMLLKMIVHDFNSALLSKNFDGDIMKRLNDVFVLCL